MLVRVMDRSDCITLLSSSRLARLACSKDNIPYVVPISFRYVDGHIVSFSRPGQKIDWMRSNAHVCLEVDQISDKLQWKCLVIQGLFRELTDMNEREATWSILQEQIDWWEPGGMKPVSQRVEGGQDPVYFRIEIGSMSGRQAFDE